jgi:hypothetical protein
VIASHAIIGSVEVVGILQPNWLDWLRYILPMAVVGMRDLEREHVNTLINAHLGRENVQMFKADPIILQWIIMRLGWNQGRKDVSGKVIGLMLLEAGHRIL